MTALLERFTNVRKEEVAPTLAAGLYFFFILTALMVLRPVRETLGVQGGIETVRWLFVGTAVVTLLVNPVFGWLVSRYRRLFFISATYLFFAASLLVFYGLLTMAPESVGETSGMVFYVWFTVFNLFVTMVFWALMADRFSLEQSKRLFAPIAVGGTLGAIFGPWLASRLAQPIGTHNLLLVGVAFLLLGVGAAWLVTSLQPRRAEAQASADPEEPPAVDDRTVIGGSAWEGFRAVFRSRYLLGISAFVLTMTIVATFIYFTRLQLVASMSNEMDTQTTLFARIDFYTQVATLLLQGILTGHIMKRLGVPFALALLPVTAALGFIGLALAASFAMFVIFDATFRAIQRAITRPARETLFTVVSREDKYKSKAFIDTFVYRGGDVIGAQTEGVLMGLGLGVAALTATVVPLAIAWLALGVWLGRAQRSRAGTRPEPPRGAEAQPVLT